MRSPLKPETKHPSCDVDHEQWSKSIYIILALRSQCRGLWAVWPGKIQRSAELFSHSAGLFLLTYLYNLGITVAMPWVVGCLTRKNTKECRAFFAQCRALFVDLLHFLWLFVIFFIARKFCKLLFTIERGKICYFFVTFFTACIFDKLLFIVEKGQGL
jgi:hypothetical protein